MLIVPAIDIQKGKCVRLWQGDFSKETDYGDPLEVALDFAKAAAKLLHIIDMDGARIGQPQNLAVVKKIIEKTGIPVQFGGGLRSKENIKEALEAGVDKIIIGTAALENSQILDGIDKEKIIIALDVRNNQVVAKGWQKSYQLNVFDLLKKWELLGISNFIYTNVLRDGTLEGPDFETIKKLISQSQSAIYLAGGVSQISDLEKLKNIGVTGVIIGRAMYTNEDLKKYASNQNYTLS